MRSLLGIKQGIKQAIKPKKKYTTIAQQNLTPKNKTKTNFLYIEELLEKQVEQNKQIIGLLAKMLKLLDIEDMHI